MLDRGGRVKPCGGAIPPRLIQDFEIPDELLVAKARCARMIAPSNKQVDMPIDNGFVGMVNRESFDEWLRERAEEIAVLEATGAGHPIGDAVGYYVSSVETDHDVAPDSELGALAHAITHARTSGVIDPLDPLSGGLEGVLCRLLDDRVRLTPE